ncbi:MAG: hypothetical protein EP344_17760 [Bacteroidetes bacterium]|nr:MAG: hypothetical protein EP344_17760 [Bacteroidota bacterium]
MFSRLFPLLFLLLASAPASAQALSGISTRWSDSFVEWELFVFAPPDSSQVVEEGEDPPPPEEELFGELKLRWLNIRDDFSEWDYTLGENESGTIKLKWKSDPSHWELRSWGGTLVTMRTSWANDLTEWRVTDNSISLNLRSRWNNQLDEWIVDDPNRGTFYMYTLTEGDARDWAIEDNLDASVPEAMKMAMIFLVVFHSSPRL